METSFKGLHISEEKFEELVGRLGGDDTEEHEEPMKKYEDKISYLPTKQLDELIKARDKLEALEAGGVDNWDWYRESLKEYNRKYYPEKYEDNAES